jgi:hypothetical protein
MPAIAAAAAAAAATKIAANKNELFLVFNASESERFTY